jgi:leishmanolysin
MIEMENQISTGLHEITHILGFSGSLYKHYQDENLNTRGKNNVVGHNSRHMIIKSPHVVNYARQYYGCNSLQGVELENAGGSGTAGAHWERSNVGDEYMTGADINEPKISKFTLNIFKDSGWYNPDMNLADRLRWGKGDGCDFISKKCRAR